MTTQFLSFTDHTTMKILVHIKTTGDHYTSQFRIATQCKQITRTFSPKRGVGYHSVRNQTDHLIGRRSIPLRSQWLPL